MAEINTRVQKDAIIIRDSKGVAPNTAKVAKSQTVFGCGDDCGCECSSPEAQLEKANKKLQIMTNFAEIQNRIIHGLLGFNSPQNCEGVNCNRLDYHA